MQESRPEAPESTRGERFAFCLYDFGNSAFPTVIITAVYAVYFQATVVGGEAGESERLWGLATSLGALLVFVAAPFLGTLADRYACKRALMTTHAWVCIAATAALIATGPGTVAIAMVLIVVSIYGFEGANVFYNAFLPELVPKHRIASLSGRAWAFGYAGGLACLLLVLGVHALGIGWRGMPLVVALWFFVFTLPAIAKLRDRPRPAGEAANGAGVGARIARLRGHPQLARFLAAMFCYMNGLNTVYVFAGAFAVKGLGFSATKTLVLVMLLNLIAAPGALWFGRIAERYDAKRSIGLSLWLWLLAIAGAILAATPEIWSGPGVREGFFWGVAALASLCIGATQATSRTFVGELAPAGMSGEFFGFMAFAGRASAVLGPWVYGEAASLSGGDLRVALASVAGFFVLGIVLLRRV